LKEKEMEVWKKEQQAKQEVDKELLLYEVCCRGSRPIVSKFVLLL